MNANMRHKRENRTKYTRMQSIFSDKKRSFSLYKRFSSKDYYLVFILNVTDRQTTLYNILVLCLEDKMKGVLD